MRTGVHRLKGPEAAHPSWGGACHCECCAEASDESEIFVRCRDESLAADAPSVVATIEGTLV